MADKTTQTPAANHQRPKILLAILLAVALLAALSWNQGGPNVEEPLTAASPTATAAAGTPAPVVAAGPPPQPSATTAATAKAKTPVLPKIDLPWILAHNPFELAVPERSAEGAQSAPATAADLATMGNRASRNQAPASRAVGEATAAAPEESPPEFAVSAIVESGGSAAALIGDRIVRENDLLDDRWRIVKITRAGIVVRPALTAVPGSE